MDQVKNWGVNEFKRLSTGGGFFESEELNALFDNLCVGDPNKISSELSNLMDSTLPENRNFIKDFQERV